MSRLKRAIEVAAQHRESNTAEETFTEVEVLERPGGMECLLDVDPLQVTHPFLASWNERDRGAGEAYRKLRSVVVQLTRGEEFHNALMLTSAISGEGKTLTSLNLALALAQEYDHTVLLVDADLRRPSIHQYLGIKPEVGLVHCLRDGVPLSKALVKTGLGKLVVLPAGEALENPVELLGSARMKEVVRELKTRYPERYVLFDTPPVLPFADAQVLSQAMDGVLFVIQENGPKMIEVQEALAALKDVPMLGAIYNDALTIGKKRKYYYGYK